MRNLDTVMFIEEPPEIECWGGLFFIRQRYSANFVVERVMQPATMFAGFQRAAQAIQAYHASAGEETDDSAVLHFPRAS